MSRKLTLTACTVDLETGEVSGDGAARLTHRELVLLRYLVERSPEVVGRETLSTEAFGYAPTAVTRAVDKAMHGLRAKVERDPSAPDHLHTVAGVGYRFAAVEPQQTPTNLLPPRGPLLGREEDAAELTRALARSEVALVGPGGVGKTRLATAVAWERRLAFPGGAWFCDLSQASTAADVLVELGALTGQPLRDEASFGAWLAQKPPVLFVLDNADAVAGWLGETLPTWSATAPSARFLVTSRTVLPAIPCRRLEPLPVEAALRLLEAKVVDQGGSLAQTDRGLLPDLLERLDRMPLAIECAAFPLATTMTARELLEHLRSFGEVPAPGDPRRSGSMRSTVAASWALLDAERREALVALGALPGSVSAEGAAAALDLSSAEALSVLAALRQRSLLTTGRAPSEPDRLRFALYESVRDFVASLGGWTDERRAAWARYRRWLLERGEEVNQSLDLGSPGQRLLAAERAALLAMVDEAEQDPTSAMRALSLLEGSWFNRDPAGYAGAIERVLLVEGGRLQREHRLFGQCLRAYASVRAQKGEAKTHLAALEELVSALTPQDDPRWGTRICSRFSSAAFDVGDARCVAVGARVRLRLWEGVVGDRERMGMHISAGNALRLLGDRQGAEAHYRQALARPVDPLGEGIAWANLALLRPPDEAVDLFRRAFAVLPPENREAASGLRADFASALARTRALEESKTEALIARKEARALGRHGGWFRANLLLAQLDREEGAPQQALTWLDELAAEPRFDPWMGVVWDLRGTLLVDAGQWEMASEAFQRALEKETKPTPYDVSVLARAHRAVVLARLGRLEEASAEIERAQQDRSEPMPGSVRIWTLPRLALAVGALDPASDRAALETALRQVPPCPFDASIYLPLEVAMAQRWAEGAIAAREAAKG